MLAMLYLLHTRMVSWDGAYAYQRQYVSLKLCMLDEKFVRPRECQSTAPAKAIAHSSTTASLTLPTTIAKYRPMPQLRLVWVQQLIDRSGLCGILPLLT